MTRKHSLIGCVIQPELHFGDPCSDDRYSICQMPVFLSPDISPRVVHWSEDVRSMGERNNITDGVKVKSIGTDHATCFIFNILISIDN